MKKIDRCHWQYVLFSIKGAWNCLLLMVVVKYSVGYISHSCCSPVNSVDSVLQ